MKYLLMIIAILLGVNCADLTAGEYVVGFAQDNLGNDWRLAQARQMSEQFAAHGDVRFYYTDAKGSVAVQIEDVDRMISENVDVLITSPKDHVLMVPVLKKAMAKGIPVVLVSRGVDDDSAYTCFIHPSNRKIATEAADYMAKCLKGHGNVFVLQHTPTTTPAIERTEGFMERIKKYPGVKVIGMAVANSDRREAMTATLEMFGKRKDIGGIYAQSDSMAVGAVLALQHIGVPVGSMCLTGIDYILEAKKLISDGLMDATYIYPTGAQEAVRITMDILHGKKVPKELVIPVKQIDRSNYQSERPIF